MNDSLYIYISFNSWLYVKITGSDQERDAVSTVTMRKQIGTTVHIIKDKQLCQPQM